MPWGPDPDHLILPSGPSPCDILLVGEAGGEHEHFKRQPFVGKAGSVLTAYLQAAGLPRPNVRITNVYPFWLGPGNPDPTPEQIKAEEWRLEEEIRKTKPRVIGTLGAVAARWFLGDVTLEQTHGIPHFSPRAKGAVVVPCFHPAAGFYNPATAALCQDDIHRLAYYLKNPVEAKSKLRPRISLCRRAPVAIEGAAVDTEGLADRPWGLSYSQRGKEGKVWICRGRGRLQRPPQLRGKITFQNALHDLPVLRSIGIDTDGLDYDDTMVMLFNLQLEAQGLKPAAYRYLGLKMSEFDEVVRPHFNRLALRFLKKAAEFEYPKPEPRPIEDYAKRRYRLYRPQGAGKRLTAILKAWDKDPAGVRLEKRWKDLGDEFQAQAEERVGERFPRFSIFCVPKKKAVRYSGTDAVATAALAPKLRPLLRARGLEKVYEMDRRALPFVDRMQQTGMKIDTEKMQELREELADRQRLAAHRIRQVVGDRWFNPGSSQQVARWLYDVRGIDPPKLTKGSTSLSTADETLKMIRGYSAKEDEELARFLTDLMDYRECGKYIGTFIEPILERALADPEHRLHCNFRVTRVVSGRLSSHEPNILATPTRTKLGKKIRECMVAAEGYSIVCCDLSQIELRTMADHCRDPRMRQAFENEEDLHNLTTSILFEIPLQRVKKDSSERYVAKTINFAVMYGISARALLELLYKADIFDFTLEDCERFIAEWFRIYGSVRVYLERVWAKAEKEGLVRDMWGRICYVPNIRLTDRKMRESAQRLAGNFPIQSGAHGLVKIAEADIIDWIRDYGLEREVRPWLQFHDEIDLEVRQGMEQEVGKMLEHFMVREGRRRFSVPVEAEAGWGRNWAEAKA